MTLFAFNSFLVALLCIPAATLLSARLNRGRMFSSLLLLAVMAGGVAVAGDCWLRGTRLSVDLSGFGPLPFALTIDRLSAFFLLLICATSLPVVLFSISYIERHYQGPRSTWFWVLLPWFLLSMIVVVTASTAFAFLFGWELMTLVSAGLILIDGDSKERRHNIFIYLVMMHAGAAAVFAAFLCFLPHAGGLSFPAIRSAVLMMSPGTRTAVFLLAFVGFSAKAGVIPLHLWLPRAHPIAPSPVSALMSGVMLKTAIYGFIRFTFDFLGTGPSWWGYLALAVGAISGLLGVLYAIAENDLKRLLAYSSVENIGIIYLGLGSSLVLAAHHEPGWAALALCAALLHSLNHAFFKSLLFLGAGAISDATHTLDIEELGGLLRRMPATGTAILIACCSISGLPLFNGFISEWLTFRSFMAGAALENVPAAIVLPLMIGMLALIGGLAAACFAKVYGVAFLGRPRSEAAKTAGEIPPPMRAAMIMLAGACVWIGVFPGAILRSLGQNAQELLGGKMVPIEVAALARVMPVVAFGFITLVAAGLIIRRARRTTATWGCGLPRLDSRMQYTGTAFSKPIRKVFAQVYRPDRTVDVLPPNNPYFPSSIAYRSVRTTSFERFLYRPAMDAIVATGLRLRRLQTGNIQVYLLYLFLALVGVLLFMRFA
jgi:hydrogenase-4 component B